MVKISRLQLGFDLDDFIVSSDLHPGMPCMNALVHTTTQSGIVWISVIVNISVRVIFSGVVAYFGYKHTILC